MNSRQLAARETRQKLLQAGKRLVCEKGLDQTSVEEITEAAGVSKGTFYTYFRKKEEIVLELSASMFGEILDGAKAFPGNFPKKLTRYMAEFSGYIQQGGVRLAQDWIKGVVTPVREGEASDRWKLRQDLESMEDLIRFGIRRGMLREDTPAAQLAAAFVDILYGQLLCWCMSDGVYSLRERTENFCGENLETMLGKYLTEESI